MVNSEINAVLNENGYTTSSIINLPDFSEIVLASDECIYPNKKTGFLFNALGGDLLFVYERDSETDWSSLSIETERPSLIVHYANITGFHLTGPNKRKTPYIYGTAI